MKKDEWRLLKKYTSHFIWKSCVCERELETEQNCNILTPTLMAISVVSFSFSRPAQPEAWGPLCWILAFSIASCHPWVSKLQTNWLPVFTELYNCSIAHSIFGMACMIVIKMVPDASLFMIRYGSRVKWVNPGKILGVVAIEKGAFGTPSMTVANFTFTLFWWYKHQVFLFKNVWSENLRNMIYRQTSLLLVSGFFIWIERHSDHALRWNWNDSLYMFCQGISLASKNIEECS